MRTIWKYIIVPNEPEMKLRVGAKPLCVQVQGGEVCLWMLVDPNAEAKSRRVVVVGTGHDLPEDFPVDYVGTVQMAGGALVLHVFIERE